MIKKLLPYAIVAAITAISVWFTKPDPDPVYQRVEVPVETIVEVERVDTIVTFKEKIVYVEVEPKVVAVADSGAHNDVDAFCQEAVERALAQLDTAAEEATPPPPMLLLRSVRLDKGFLWKADELVATGPRSDGSLWQGTYDVHRNWQAHVKGPDLLVQSPRFWWLWEIAEIAIPAAGGYLVGRLGS